MTMAV